MFHKLLFKDKLEEQAKIIGFNLINVEIELDSVSNKIEIQNETEFINFHKMIENKSLFYTYEYENELFYTIPDEFHQGYNEIIQESVSVKIKEYNIKLKEIDFNLPSSLSLYYLKDGFLFLHQIVNEEIYSLSNFDDVVSDIVDEVLQEVPEDDLDKMRKNREDKINSDKQKLKEHIFADPKFKVASNLSHRQRYTSQFFKDSPEFKELLFNAGYNHPIHFIEEIWKEFKEKGLHK